MPKQSDDPFVRYSVFDELSLFFRSQQSFFFEFFQKLRELRLRNVTMLFDVSNVLFALREDTEDAKPLGVGEELEKVRDFFGVSFKG